MASIRSYRHGLTVSIPNRMGNPEPSPRGASVGWSASAARRNLAFLRSIDERELTGHGFAVTLTLRDCPTTPRAWQKLVDVWFKRQARRDMLRAHWVMEFQRRGVPHLHAAIWFADEVVGGLSHAMISDWVELAADHGAGVKAQDVRPLTPGVGWFIYLGKHASRSYAHYQRQRDTIPAEWLTGCRVWGKRGTFAIQPPEDTAIRRQVFYRIRRASIALDAARLRAAGQFGQAKTLRRLLKRCPTRELSAVRPVSQWMSAETQAALVKWATTDKRMSSSTQTSEVSDV
jgi:hypothetical protein